MYTLQGKTLFHEKRERFSGSCAANAGKIKDGYACLGEGLNMLKMISDDFGKTAQCNYHMTTSHISNLPYALAFRVSSCSLLFNFLIWISNSSFSFLFYIQKGSPYIEEVSKHLHYLVESA